MMNLVALFFSSIFSFPIIVNFNIFVFLLLIHFFVKMELDHFELHYLILLYGRAFKAGILSMAIILCYISVCVKIGQRTQNSILQQQDELLRGAVEETGTENWTTVAFYLKEKQPMSQRTGKQCRQRWYNHLNPIIKKEVWSLEEERHLFTLQKKLGNRWKEISHMLEGRTDNSIKNHFYSTLRRSLRRLNKLSGKRNSTNHLRQIKPSVLTSVLQFIYEHEQVEFPLKGVIEQLKDLPSLIFQLASFKPVKRNMGQDLRENNQSKINTIFRLIQQFQKCLQNGKIVEKEDSSESESLIFAHGPFYQVGQFTSMSKPVQILISTSSNSYFSTSFKTTASSSQKQNIDYYIQQICQASNTQQLKPSIFKNSPNNLQLLL